MARLPVDAALRAITRVNEAAAQRASAAMAPALDSIASSRWPEVAWSFSSLTADRYPFEFSFDSHASAVRWAAEVAGPEVPERARLEAAFAYPRANVHAKAAEWFARAAAMQRNAGLAFGAWIGGSHTADQDRFKVYAEVPDAAGRLDVAGDWLAPEVLACLRGASLRMLGVAIDDGEAEFYFRVDRMETWEVDRLAARSGVPHRAGALTGLIAEIATRPASRWLPWSRVGLSLRTGAPGFCLFGIARAIVGDDSSIRSRLLGVARERGWPLSGYAEASAPLATPPRASACSRVPARTYHGMLAFCVGARSVSVRVGLRPPLAVGPAAFSTFNHGVHDALAR